MMGHFLQETHKLFSHLRHCDEGQRAQVGEPNLGKSYSLQIFKSSNLKILKELLFFPQVETERFVLQIHACGQMISAV